jgi:SAM-dependent methyltransferase
VESTEIRWQASQEDRHWWFRERRVLLRRELRGMPPGRALDIGAGAGGNTRVLVGRGWDAVAVEYSADGAQIARERGIPVVRADALALPVRDRAVDLVVAFDVLEHLDDDRGAAAEIHRVLRPGGTALVAVPADPRLWSAHDDAVGHVRRYTRDTLPALITGAGLEIESVGAWNVLLRPVAAWRRRRLAGSDVTELPPVVNLGLSAVIALERYLPVGGLPGVSLLLRARRTQRGQQPG